MDCNRPRAAFWSGRKADNWTAFTDGYRTWINGPNGLEQRLNTERFEWEYDYAPGGGIATPTPTPMELNPEHILVPVLEVMRSTPSGEGAYQDLLRLGVGITFGGNPPWGKYIFDVPSNRIVLYGNYVHEAPDTIAHLVAEATELAKWFHVHGEPTTPEECIERKYLVLTSREIWLTEFNGHSPVSDVERRLRAQDMCITASTAIRNSALPCQERLREMRILRGRLKPCARRRPVSAYMIGS